MSEIEISVIVPAYNEAGCIADCISALLEQDMPPNSYEVIVVDNHSTDKTAEIAAAFAGIVVVSEAQQQGIPSARMAGIAAARGRIIATTDADTIVPRNWLSSMLGCYADTDVVAVGGTASFRSAPRWLNILNKSRNRSLKTTKSLLGFNMSFRKSAYTACGGYRSEINVNEDFYISRQLARIGKILILEDIPVITSRRRYDSPLWVLEWLEYIINAATITLFKKAYLQKYRIVREP
ncbi:MAG: glycosyltransferase [Chloroflexi bacterium]|nr:glycosyltransferase [Chloroflexota bacterium]